MFIALLPEFIQQKTRVETKGAMENVRPRRSEATERNLTVDEHET